MSAEPIEQSTTPAIKRYDDAKIPVHSIPLSSIKVEDKRGRTDFGPIIELAQNIKDRGLINPVLVSKRPGGGFSLIAGERRFRAHVFLGETHIDARIREEMSPLQSKLLELDENIVRKQLTWDEQATLTMQIHELMQQIHGVRTQGGNGRPDGWTMEKTAEHLGMKSKAAVSKQIKVAKAMIERPELKEKLTRLPLEQAYQELGKIEKTEVLSHLQATGLLTISHDLVKGDAREVLKAQPAGSFNLLLTDGPFGVPAIAEYEGKERYGAQYVATLGATDNLTLDLVIPLMKDISKEVFRLLAPGSHAFFFMCMDLYPALVSALLDAGMKVDPVPLIWNKGRTTAPFMGYRPAPCYEPILFSWKPLGDDGKPRKFQEPLRYILDYPPVESEKKIHAFQKPQDLLSFLIRVSTQRGERVLDPFAGSGSTLLAARDLGRSALGVELSEENYLRAQDFLSGKAKA